MAAPRRRSARISALEDTMKAQQANCEEYEAFFENDEFEEFMMGSQSGSEPEPGPKKRGRKKKKMDPLDEVPEGDTSTKEMQHAEKQDNTENRSSPNDDASEKPLAGSLVTKLPEKRLLKLVIETLEKGDSRRIFALPVDAEMVQGYYEIIKEPMDFLSINAKLDDGAYESLEQFERDVFLIFNNAMLFNGENTVYYKQARSLYALGKSAFQALREDPARFEAEYSTSMSTPMRRRPGRKPKIETKISNENTELRDTRSTYEPRLARSTYEPRDVHSAYEPRDARRTYVPWGSYLSETEALISDLSAAPKLLIPANVIEYRQSLTLYSKDFGPVAKAVAEKILQQCPAPNPTRIPTSGSGLLLNRAPTGITDLNLPPTDGTSENDSYLLMMTDGSRSEPPKVSSNPVASQARLLDFQSLGQTTRDVCLGLPSSSNQVPGPSMFDPRPSYPPRPTSIVHPSTRVFPAKQSVVPPSTTVLPAKPSAVPPSAWVSQAKPPSQPNLASPYPEPNQFNSLVRSDGVNSPGPNLGFLGWWRPSNNGVNLTVQPRVTSQGLALGQGNAAPAPDPSSTVQPRVTSHGLALGQGNAAPTRDPSATVQPRVTSQGLALGQGNAAPTPDPSADQGNLFRLWNNLRSRIDNHNHSGIQPGDTRLNLNALPAPVEASRSGTIGLTQLHSTPWNQQAARNDRMHNVAMNSWAHNRAVQPQLIGLGPPASNGVPANIYARNMIQNQQSQLNTNQASLDDNQEPNVVLQL